MKGVGIDVKSLTGRIIPQGSEVNRKYIINARQLNKIGQARPPKQKGIQEYTQSALLLRFMK